jgi:hypothetical protein
MTHIIFRFIKRRPFATLAIAVGVATLLTAASYFTTGRFWTGGFLDGEFRLTVVDGAGEPIRGAVFHISNSGNRRHDDLIPFNGKQQGNTWKTDDDGKIVLIQPKLQKYGGFSWSLFWVIPMGAEAARFECELGADGYQTIRFPIWRLYESPHVMREDFPMSKRGLPIREHRFTLKKS